MATIVAPAPGPRATSMDMGDVKVQVQVEGSPRLVLANTALQGAVVELVDTNTG